MDISIVIVSYNTKNLLAKCLESIAEDLRNSNKKFAKHSSWREVSQTSISGEIIVVDNGSTDGSVEVAAKFKVSLIENNKNLGFGKANNLGAKKAKGRYLLFLNSDTEVTTGALAKMVDFMDRNPQIGIAGCRLLNSDGTIQPQGGYLPRLSTVAVWALFLDDLPVLRDILPSYQMGKARRGILSGVSWRRQETPDYKEIGWVGGTAMFVRRQTWKQLGGFDENIFMYGEDVEICYRANRKSWKTAINPQSQIIHAGKASGGKWIVGEIEGLLYIFKKYKPAWEMPILRMILAAGMGLRWLIFGILGRNEELRQAYAESFRLAGR